MEYSGFQTTLRGVNGHNLVLQNEHKNDVKGVYKEDILTSVCFEENSQINYECRCESNLDALHLLLYPE